MWAKAAAVGNAAAWRRVVHECRRCAARRIVHMSIAPPGAQRPAPPLGREHGTFRLLMFKRFGIGFAQATKDHLFCPF